MDTMLNVNEITKRLLPLTLFRRRAGDVLKNLSQVKMYVITKDGKPVAKLTALDEPVSEETKHQRLAKLKSLSGGFRLGKGMSPSQIDKLLDKRYEQMLPR